MFVEVALFVVVMAAAVFVLRPPAARYQGLEGDGLMDLESGEFDEQSSKLQQFLRWFGFVVREELSYVLQLIKEETQGRQDLVGRADKLAHELFAERSARDLLEQRFKGALKEMGARLDQLASDLVAERSARERAERALEVAVKEQQAQGERFSALEAQQQAAEARLAAELRAVDERYQSRVVDVAADKAEKAPEEEHEAPVPEAGEEHATPLEAGEADEGEPQLEEPAKVEEQPEAAGEESDDGSDSTDSSGSDSDEDESPAAVAPAPQVRMVPMPVGCAPMAAPAPAQIPRPENLEKMREMCDAFSLAGTKPEPNWECQDAHLFVPLSETLVLAAVFDGHGQHGRNAAFVARNVFGVVSVGLPSPATAEAAKAFFEKLFQVAHQAIGSQMDAAGQCVANYSGTTVTAAVIDLGNKVVHTAHVGDSRMVVLDEERKVTFETVDHVVDDACEARCVAAGGEVRSQDVGIVRARRVFLKGSMFPGIMMSRSLGDFVAHSLGLLAEPEVSLSVPLPDHGVLCLCSDGVWEHGTESLSAVPEGAEAVVTHARSQWPPEYSDDITALIVTLQ